MPLLWANGSLYQSGAAGLALGDDAAAAAGLRIVGWLERLGWPRPPRWFAELSGHDPLARMLLDLSMPRLLCALLPGALLAVSGVAMQSVVHNPLAVALTGIVTGAQWTTRAQWLITQESVRPARFVVWLAGGTYGRNWGEVSMLVPWCVLAVPVFAWLAKPLDMLALGDDRAAALGLPAAMLRPLALTIATLAACAAVGSGRSASSG